MIIKHVIRSVLLFADNFRIQPTLQEKKIFFVGLTIDDIEVFEINEAFASQAAYCVEKLGIPMEKVNPKGGAIALGHPLGCTGARQVSTLLHELKRRGNKYVKFESCFQYKNELRVDLLTYLAGIGCQIADVTGGLMFDHFSEDKNLFEKHASFYFLLSVSTVACDNLVANCAIAFGASV